MRYEILDENGGVVDTIIACLGFVEARFPGRYREVDAGIPASQEDPCKWFIDIGPFFDRFGPALMPILLSQDAVVIAIMKNLQVRKWIDLKRADVSSAMDILLSKEIANMTPTLANTVLTTPVAEPENMALKKLYFS